MTSLPDVTKDPDITIPVEGEQVAATRFSPSANEDALPAILWTTPYHKERERFMRYGTIFHYVAAHGYEVILANLVGTGASTGQFAGLLTPEIGNQCHTIVDWIADQPWTTGRVGALGKSAGGYTCLETAAQDPEPLEAAVPIMHPYESSEGLYPGGLPRLNQLMGWIGLYALMAAQPTSRRDSEGEWQDHWHHRLDALREEGPELIGVPELFTDERSNYRIPIEEITAPTFAIGGFRDTFSQDMISYFQEINAPKRLLMGPWRHIMPYRAREVTIASRQQIVEWFDQFLKDQSRGALEKPRITYWTEQDGGRQIDTGVWRGRDQWPTHEYDTRSITFAVTDAGLERIEELENIDSSVEKTYSFDQTVGVESMDFGSDFLDTGPDDIRSLAFESDPLEVPIEWTGSGVATINLSVNNTEGALCVRIMDVTPDNRSRPITRGGQRLGDGPKGVSVDSEESNIVSVNLRPASHVFEPGHRIRFAIAAADFPRYLPVGPDGMFTIRSNARNPTSIEFPGEYDPPFPFEETYSMDPPDDDIFPVTPTHIQNSEISGKTCRAHHTGTTSVERKLETRVDYPHIQGTRVAKSEKEYSITPNDPDSLTAEGTAEIILNHEDKEVRITANTSITRDELELELTAQDGDDMIFAETWVDELQ